jgi:hypothetical protein
MDAIAFDGKRCFGYSIDGNGRAVCNHNGAFCECRSPHKSEVLDLELFIREQDAANKVWGLTPEEAITLAKARERLAAAKEST